MSSHRAARRFVSVLILLAVTCSFVAVFAYTQVASAQDELPTATVLVARLNVRSGPGTTYARIGQVSVKEVLEVTGQAQNCGWLKVQTDELDGWVSGQRQYVQLSAPCSSIPAATPAAKPTVTAAPTVATTSVTTATAAPAATPAAAPTETPTEVPTEGTAVATAVATAVPAETPVEDPLPPDMGCFLMENTVGPELNVTTTNKETGESGNFKVPANGETVWCLDPGNYAFTIDAPPPWADLNTDRKISAGERFVWAIGGKE